MRSVLLLVIKLRCITLRAARLPISSCTTPYTAPMPPRPNSRSTIHGPAFAPGSNVSGSLSSPDSTLGSSPGGTGAVAAVETIVCIPHRLLCSVYAGPSSADDEHFAHTYVTVRPVVAATHGWRLTPMSVTP